MRHPIHEIWRDTYFDVIEEWRQRYGNGHLEIRKMKIKEANLFNIGLDSLTLCYMLFSYQTGYIMWHSRLRIYIPWGAAEGNIHHKPGMSHYREVYYRVHNWKRETSVWKMLYILTIGWNRIKSNKMTTESSND
jgi:hypothetical protein